MPHILVLAIISSSNSDHEIEDKLGPLLYPHAYYFEFPPFRIPCDCTWSSEKGIEKANNSIGDFHKLWNSFLASPETIRPDWTEYIREWVAKAIEATKASPDYKQPNPQCNYCNGTGFVISTSPPSGLRYEAWAPNQWEKVGIISDVTIDPRSYEAILTPDGQAHMRYEIFKSKDFVSWATETKNILQEFNDYLAVKCFVNK